VYDLVVSNRCNANAESYTSPVGSHHANEIELEGKTLSTGSANFQVKEIEVFHIPGEMALVKSYLLFTSFRLEVFQRIDCFADHSHASKELRADFCGMMTQIFMMECLLDSSYAYMSCP
jgi:hypothetical protein